MVRGAFAIVWSERISCFRENSGGSKKVVGDVGFIKLKSSEVGEWNGTDGYMHGIKRYVSMYQKVWRNGTPNPRSNFTNPHHTILITYTYI